MTELSSADQRHNLYLNSAHELSWGFGIAFHDVATILPLFMVQLGAPLGIVASLAGLFTILMALPQLLSALLGRNIRNIKLAVVGTHALAWPPVFMAGFTFAFFAPQGPSAWMFYYLCFILYGLSVGIILPIWAGFLKHATRREGRGTFFGISFAFNSVGGFIGGIFAHRLLASTIPFPRNFGWGFLILSVAIIAATLLFFGYRIPKPEEVQAHKSVRQFWQEVRDIIRTHTNFRRYLLSRIFFTASFPAVSLYAVYTYGKFGFESSTAGLFTATRVVAFGLASYLAGKIGDRYGHKNAITFAFACHLAALLTALMAQTMVGVYSIFMFLGLGQGSFFTSSMSLVYDFAGTRDSKTYMALIDTFLAPFTLLAIVIGGSLSETLGVATLFKGISILMVVGLAMMIFSVRDPKYHSQEPTPSHSL